MHKPGGNRKLAPIPAPVLQHHAQAVPTAVAPALAQDGATKAHVPHLSCTAWSMGLWFAGRPWISRRRWPCAAHWWRAI